MSDDRSETVVCVECDVCGFPQKDPETGECGTCWALARLSGLQRANREIEESEEEAASRGSRAMDEGKCKSCGALILWATSAKTGKPMPLNPVPDIDGNVEVRKGKVSDTYYCRVLTPADQGDRKLYVAHFTTCPDAKRWRKR